MRREKEWIPALQGVRTIAFLEVFVSHAMPMQSGAAGVSLFLVLSGFLAYYNNSDKYALNKSINIWTLIQNVKEKIKRLYPLHAITFALALMLGWNGLSWSPTRKTIISMAKIVTNVFLLQSWIPKSEFYFSFNSVSWYLSVCVFLYFVTPCIIKKINFARNRNKQGVLAILVFQLCVSLLLYMLRDYNSNIPIIVSDNMFKWITYICPIYRLGEYVCGMLICKEYMESERNTTHYLINTLFQIGALGMVPLLVMIFTKQNGFWGSEAARYSLLFSLDSILIIYFMTKPGVVSSILGGNVIIRHISRCSGAAFLIHQLVISTLRPFIKCTDSRLESVIFVTVSLCISIVLSDIWVYLFCKKGSKLKYGSKISRL